ncbi:MAG: hypothetical protein ACK40M_11500 [Flavobacteriales bacterium]
MNVFPAFGESLNSCSTTEHREASLSRAMAGGVSPNPALKKSCCNLMLMADHLLESLINLPQFFPGESGIPFFEKPAASN